jgi:hypothetical protein
MADALFDVGPKIDPKKFDPSMRVYAPHNNTPTSEKAAAAIVPEGQRLRRQVLEFIRQRGEAGATDEEIQMGLGMNPNTERPRRIELEQGGHITRLMKDGVEVTRLTKSLRKAAIFVVKA